MGGFSQVLHSRYLLLIAVMIVLLNWVNTTGEYLLAELVIAHVDSLIAVDPSLDKGNLIAGFYGNFFLGGQCRFANIAVVCCVESRSVGGVRGAVLVLPIIALVGYGLMVFIPVFGVIRVVKMAENATDYSLMNTARHALFCRSAPLRNTSQRLPSTPFFWRFGDLIQALAVYAGLNLFGFRTPQFAMLNMVLALAWLVLAMLIGRRYVGLEKPLAAASRRACCGALRPQPAPPGTALLYRLPPNLFTVSPVIFSPVGASCRWWPAPCLAAIRARVDDFSVGCPRRCRWQHLVDCAGVQPGGGSGPRPATKVLSIREAIMLKYLFVVITLVMPLAGISAPVRATTGGGERPGATCWHAVWRARPARARPRRGFQCPVSAQRG